ncbi:diphthine synthase [Arthrobotrys megalospora]
MLYCIGLGLSDEKDITLKGLEIVRRAERVYLEAYTSILMVSREKLEEFYGRQLIIADRELVESDSDAILKDANSTDIAFLVVGDPFGATTHLDLLLRARSLQIPVKTIHNASIMNAIGACGLQLYNFGQTVSMVFFTDTWKPSSFYDKIRENAKIGLHTLVLLDIKVKEQSEENLARGRKIYEPPRYMTVAQCASQMLTIEEIRQEGVYNKDSLAIGIARLGSDDQTFAVGTLGDLTTANLGPPLHSLVLVGKVHDMEMQFIREFAVDSTKFDTMFPRAT